jgi:hypothetical protein
MLQPQELLGALLGRAQSQVGKAVGDVVRQFLEQRQLAAVEGIGLACEYAEDSQHLVPAHQRKRGSCLEPVLHY